MQTRTTRKSAQFSALKGAIDYEINLTSYILEEQARLKAAVTDVALFYKLVNERTAMVSKLLLESMQSSGVSQAALCDEINCEKTQLNKALRFAEENNPDKFPRCIPYPAIESLCNHLDINMSKLFLGLDMKIPLPKQYIASLEKMSGLSERKQSVLVKKLQELSKDYLSVPNVMTVDDNTAIPVEEFRFVIGRRCRLYTDERNMPPAYIIESGPIRRKATNLFDMLNSDNPVFVGRISVLMAICYTSHLPMEYFLIRDLSQERLIGQIQYFEDKQPTQQQLDVLKLFCNTEQNADLHNTLVATALSI